MVAGPSEGHRYPDKYQGASAQGPLLREPNVGKIPLGGLHPVGKIPLGGPHPVTKISLGGLHPLGKISLVGPHPVGKISLGGPHPVDKISLGDPHPVGKIFKRGLRCYFAGGSSFSSYAHGWMDGWMEREMNDHSFLCMIFKG